MYLAVITNDFPNSSGKIPIVEGPLAEIAITKANVKMPWIIRNSVIGDLIRNAIRDAFYDTEREAKRKTIKLASEYK